MYKSSFWDNKSCQIIIPQLIHQVQNQYEVSLQIQNTVLDFRGSTYKPRFTVISSALYSRRTAKMLKKQNIGRDVMDFHENPPSPHILPSLTVTKSVYPPPPPLRDVINGWPLTIKLKKWYPRNTNRHKRNSVSEILLCTIVQRLSVKE